MIIGSRIDVKDMIDKVKNLGQIFTPNWIVELILDRLNYKGNVVLGKYIFEPGCGNGNFLYQIVDRYINVAQKKGLSTKKIKQELEKYIYGVEIDVGVYKECINRLDSLARKYDINNVKWKVLNQDILDLDKEKLPEFDYIVGNPPYVRIHNLDKNKLLDIKGKYIFCKSGIIDLFLVFFEIGILSLKQDNGKLGFITPNSFIHNSTYVGFRNYLKNEGLIKELINFKDNSLFNDASTYNAITILDKNHNSKILDYYEYIKNEVSYVGKIDLEKQDTKKWNFTDSVGLNFLDNLKNAKNKISSFATVQYGFATLLDDVYIVKQGKNQIGLFDNKIEEGVLYPVVKGSRYNGHDITGKIIYPYYLENGFWNPMPEDYLEKTYPNLYKYLLSNKSKLINRSIDKSAKYWYEYGRSQGVQTIHNNKLVISPIFKDEIKVFKVDNKTMVYSGIYLFVDEKSKYSLDDFMEVLKSTKFIRYARMVGKDMRGGYKTINTKIIKEFAI